MVGWLAVLKGLLSLADVVASYLQKKQLLTAGESAAIRKNLQETLDRVKTAQNARNSVATDPGSVRDDSANRDRH